MRVNLANPKIKKSVIIIFDSNSSKVCSVYFEPPTESPGTKALPAQLCLILVKMTSSLHDLMSKACPRSLNR